MVLNSDELRQRADWVAETLGQTALVEDFIDGPEFHVLLWGNGHITALPPAERDFSAYRDVREQLCTYDAKVFPLHLTSSRSRCACPHP